MTDELKDSPSSEKRTPLWRRLFSCWLGICAHFTNADDSGCWGECRECGKRVGFVSRETLRKYLDREHAAYLKARGAQP